MTRAEMGHFLEGYVKKERCVIMDNGVVIGRTFD